MSVFLYGMFIRGVLRPKAYNAHLLRTGALKHMWHRCAEALARLVVNSVANEGTVDGDNTDGEALAPMCYDFMVTNNDHFEKEGRLRS
jgi:hypothetical protein